ncbi:MFS transporter [Buchnera aphidicola]|uniref:MFS transporter n=1 Tax=Buchnera aphidicola (Sarucallis kahawaluokalani) TaxID=1241878 RepID=A0A4D6Y923_9GAMM|nr:MFS transporter [Buchnera aphidicola]QCI26177.1 MFS transporter [Buchnera aphidicola (Sarucallis kahawaluokalani)]
MSDFSKNCNKNNVVNTFNNEKKYIDRTTIKFKKVIIALFSAGLATFSILYCVQPILPTFSSEFHLTPAQSSLSLSAATASMAIGMLFTGSLSDTFGRKIVMSTSLLLATSLTILCSAMHTWIEIITLRMLTGLTLSGVAAVAMTYLSEEMHPDVLPFAIGLYISGNTIGGFSGRFLSSVLVNYFSWEKSLLIIGLVSLTGSLLFLFLLPNSNNFNSISLKPNKIMHSFFLQCNDQVLSVLFFIGFILMGSFVTLFNYVGYRLMIKPFFLNQVVIGLLSIVYLTGAYSSPKASEFIVLYGRKKVLIYSLLMMVIGIFITQWNILVFIIFGLMLFSSGFFAAHSISSSWIGYRSKIAKGQASSLYLCCYYLGSSILGTFGGIFWSIGNWVGISIFIVMILLFGMRIVYRINISME